MKRRDSDIVSPRAYRKRLKFDETTYIPVDVADILNPWNNFNFTENYSNHCASSNEENRNDINQFLNDPKNNSKDHREFLEIYHNKDKKLADIILLHPSFKLNCILDIHLFHNLQIINYILGFDEIRVRLKFIPENSKNILYDFVKNWISSNKDNSNLTLLFNKALKQKHTTIVLAFFVASNYGLFDIKRGIDNVGLNPEIIAYLNRKPFNQFRKIIEGILLVSKIDFYTDFEIKYQALLNIIQNSLSKGALQYIFRCSTEKELIQIFRRLYRDNYSDFIDSNILTPEFFLKNSYIKSLEVPIFIASYLENTSKSLFTKFLLPDFFNFSDEDQKKIVSTIINDPSFNPIYALENFLSLGILSNNLDFFKEMINNPTLLYSLELDIAPLIICIAKNKVVHLKCFLENPNFKYLMLPYEKIWLALLKSKNMELIHVFLQDPYYQEIFVKIIKFKDLVRIFKEKVIELFQYEKLLANFMLAENFLFSVVKFQWDNILEFYLKNNLNLPILFNYAYSLGRIEQLKLLLEHPSITSNELFITLSCQSDHDLESLKLLFNHSKFEKLHDTLKNLLINSDTLSKEIKVYLRDSYILTNREQLALACKIGTTEANFSKLIENLDLTENNILDLCNYGYSLLLKLALANRCYFNVTHAFQYAFRDKEIFSILNAYVKKHKEILGNPSLINILNEQLSILKNPHTYNEQACVNFLKFLIACVQSTNLSEAKICLNFISLHMTELYTVAFKVGCEEAVWWFSQYLLAHNIGNEAFLMQAANSYPTEKLINLLESQGIFKEGIYIPESISPKIFIILMGEIIKSKSYDDLSYFKDCLSQYCNPEFILPLLKNVSHSSTVDSDSKFEFLINSYTKKYDTLIPLTFLKDYKSPKLNFIAKNKELFDWSSLIKIGTNAELILPNNSLMPLMKIFVNKFFVDQVSKNPTVSEYCSTKNISAASFLEGIFFPVIQRSLLIKNLDSSENLLYVLMKYFSSDPLYLTDLINNLSVNEIGVFYYKLLIQKMTPGYLRDNFHTLLLHAIKCENMDVIRFMLNHPQATRAFINYKHELCSALRDRKMSSGEFSQIFSLLWNNEAIRYHIRSKELLDWITKESFFLPGALSKEDMLQVVAPYLKNSAESSIQQNRLRLWSSSPISKQDTPLGLMEVKLK